jgi:hypothetical protein
VELKWTRIYGNSELHDGFPDTGNPRLFIDFQRDIFARFEPTPPSDAIPAPPVPHRVRAPSFLHLPLMAASQIPNLNLLRRGRGRGRGGSRGVEDGHSTRTSGKDRVVQGTDNDASVSRLSAVELGYLVDPYAKALTPPGSETRRFPIINRGMCSLLIAEDNWS